ncbi:LOW QUALITY PROTEIN: hypothetical protein V1477_001891 [Vespula maculifrons]|uniref:Uncharacterized protein n=1 Tax=Vespula maculifrons TaxID=7453 RepID=A0ABD2CXI7_VESMC
MICSWLKMSNGIQRKFRSSLVEIQSKTGSVTVKVRQRPEFVVVSRGQTSDIIIYLHYLFSITCGEHVLGELRCVLVEIQNKTEPVAVKVGPPILSSRVGDIPATPLHSKTKQINIERMSDNNILTLILCYYLWRMRTARTVMCTRRNSKMRTARTVTCTRRNSKMRTARTVMCTRRNSKMRTARTMMCTRRNSKQD